MTVARLKQAGIPCEFIVEQARVYIAEKRFEKKLRPEDKLILTDVDQNKIMMNQIHMEHIMDKATGPDMIVISDSSPLNSLFYMTEEGRRTCQDLGMIEKISSHLPDLIFYAAPIRGLSLFDPNRIHNEEESLAVDNQILPVLKAYIPSVVDKVIPLGGGPEHCMSIVFAEIMKKVFE